LGVIELLQCIQWQGRHEFTAQCYTFEVDPNRDALIAQYNPLGLRPFWRPAPVPLKREYPDGPPEDPSTSEALQDGQRYTRTGTPLPEDDGTQPEAAWDPTARIEDEDAYSMNIFNNQYGIY
jgi:hypothetical protein